MKVCSNCKNELPLTDFYFRSKYNYESLNESSHYTSECKECAKERTRRYNISRKSHISAYKKVYHELNRDELNRKRRELWHKNKTKEGIKNQWLKTCFGITLDDYNKMLENQNNKCAICGRDSSEFKLALHVDHDHNTKQVRSLLCSNCNTGIGCFKENIDTILKAIDYLNKYK